MKHTLFSLWIVIFTLLGIKAAYPQNPCPDPAGLARIASSFHSSIMIDYLGRVRYWGDAANPSGTGNVTSPATLSTSLYSGTPVTVAAGSTGASSHQLYLLTDAGLYGWGASNGTISPSVTGSTRTDIISIALPQASLTGTVNLTANDISFIWASGGGLAIVTKIGNTGRTDGEVYIRNGSSGGGSSAYTYGDGTTAFNTDWHKVTTTASGNPALTKVKKLSYAQKGVMALTDDNKVYAWGERVFLGNGTAYSDYSRAAEITVPSGIIPLDIRISSGRATDWAAATVEASSQFILGHNGKLYAVGEGYRGILGQGDEVDHTSWIPVKGPSGGSTELTNVTQISNNNSHLINSQAYSIGALTSDGVLYLWGDNNYSMLGGSATSYNLPRIPPNYDVNLAKIGYFHMGGHTTVAFLRGTNRFCYIGHLIRGSMGDGSNSSGERQQYDCINTPDDYLCTPQAPLGCALPSANDLIASSVRGVLAINGQPSVVYWGESSSSAIAGGHVPDHRVLYEYNGVPKGVAASATGNATTQSSQMWILTDEGIWGWGVSANTINASLSGMVGMHYLALPSGLNAADVGFIRSARGGLAVVTTSGEVWIKAGTGSTCDPSVYGDASGALNTSWHQVTTAPGVPLTGVTELSFGGTAAMAITGTGLVYAWGQNVYLGNSAGAATYDRAQPVTLHNDFTGTVRPRSGEIIQYGSRGAIQFLVGTNGLVYGLGENTNGELGLGTSGSPETNWNHISTIASVRIIRSNNSFADDGYSMGALTYTGDLYTWGYNGGTSNGRIGQGSLSYVTVPTRPPGGTFQSIPIANFDIGGRHIIAFPATPGFWYSGSYANGSIAGGNTTSGTYNVFTFQNVSIPNCAGALYTISGGLFNDNNGMADGVVNGTPFNNPGGVPMYANLLDEGGYVIKTMPLNSNGTYEFSGLPSANYTIQISSNPGIVYQPAPAEDLHNDWRYTGAQIGLTPGAGIDPAVPNGRLPIALTGDVNNANIGVAGPSPEAPDGVRGMSGNLWHDGNGMNNGNTDGNKNPIPGTLYVSLVYPYGDTDESILYTVPVDANGDFVFPDVPVGKWEIVVHTTPQGSVVPQLPSGWVHAGGQVGNTSNSGLADSANGRLMVDIPSNTNNVAPTKLGIQQPPVAEAKSYLVNNAAFAYAPGFPVVNGYKNIQMSSTQLTGYTTGGSLSGNDPEDCAGPSACNSGTNSTFTIETIKPNTKLYYDFGVANGGIQEIVPGTSTAVITDFDMTKMVIYGAMGQGATGNELEFTYSITDAAGAKSAPVTYSIGTSEPLPLSLLSFTGYASAGTSVLEWTTAQEKNVSHFNILRSRDGKDWVKIGVVNARNSAGESAYTYVDKHPYTGTNLYKLGVEDLDGTLAYSRIVSVLHNGQAGRDITIYPNPASNQISVAIANMDKQEQATLTITDAQGIRRYTGSCNGHCDIDMSTFNPGMYFIQIRIGEELFTQKIIKK